MTELDFVLLAQECGYVALPEPLVHTVLVAVPMLQDIGGELAAQWLPQIAAGEAKVIVGLQQNLVVEDAHVADLLLLLQGDTLVAPTPRRSACTHNEAIDPSRRLFAMDGLPGHNRGLRRHGAAALFADPLNRGALGVPRKLSDWPSV